MTGDFKGAKGAILARGGVVTLLRDDKPGLVWPGWWDLPGGGREGAEAPWDCFARETFEETGLHLDRRHLRGRHEYDHGRGRGVFFAVTMPHLRACDLTLGDEGQALALMPVGRFLRHPHAIPAFRARLAAFLSRRGR